MLLEPTSNVAAFLAAQQNIREYQNPEPQILLDFIENRCGQ
jgi:hypothetical protein